MLALSVLISTSLLHRFGSKKMLIVGLGMVALGLLLLTISAFWQDPDTKFFGLAALVVYFIGAGVGPMLCFVALSSEITTETTRPVILWVCGIIFWVVAGFVAFVAPFALEYLGGYTYVIFLVFVVSEVS